MSRSRRADLQLLPQSRQGSINEVIARNIVGAGGTGSRYMCRLQPPIEAGKSCWQQTCPHKYQQPCQPATAPSNVHLLEKKNEEHASSIGAALYYVLVGPTKEHACSIGTALYYALVGPTSAVCSQRYFDCSNVDTIQVMVICKATI